MSGGCRPPFPTVRKLPSAPSQKCVEKQEVQIFLHRSEDFVGALDPDEGLGFLVPGPGPLGNPSVEFGHTGLYAAL